MGWTMRQRVKPIIDPVQIVGRRMRWECTAPRSRSVTRGTITSCGLAEMIHASKMLIKADTEGGEWSRYLTPLEFVRLLCNGEVVISGNYIFAIE